MIAVILALFGLAVLFVLAGVSVFIVYKTGKIEGLRDWAVVVNFLGSIIRALRGGGRNRR